MKLTLDRVVIRLPISIYLVILMLCAGVVLMQFPVRWVSGFLGDQTACRIVLQAPMGTIWQGSAALGFSERNAMGGGCKQPLAQTERMQWKTHCQMTGLSCTTEIQFAALEKPQTVIWGWGQPLSLIANEMTLPATVLEGLGNPWTTLRPRGDLHARWTDLTWTFSKDAERVGAGAIAEESSGVMRIVIRNLASPISPVRPLGSYEIQANLGEQRASWVLSTTAGPLLLKGQGELGPGWDGKGLQFSGEASADPDAEDALLGLLSLLGKKEGGTYRLKL
jgi:general secretion pathway protein N